MYCAARFYQSPYSNGGLPKDPGGTCHTILGRLAHQGPHSSTGSLGHKLVSPCTHPTRLVNQLPQKLTYTEPINHIPGPTIRLRDTEGIPTPRQDQHIDTDNPVILHQTENLCRGLLAPSGPHDINPGSRPLCQISPQAPATQFPTPLEQKPPGSEPDNPHFTSDQRQPPIVENRGQPQSREELGKHYMGDSNDGRQPQRLGGSLPEPHPSGYLVQRGDSPTHQCTGTTSNRTSIRGLVNDTPKPSNSSAIRQCNSRSICQQTGGHTQQVGNAGGGTHTYLGGKFSSKHISGFHTRNTELGGGLLEPNNHRPGGVVTQRQRLPTTDPQMGHSGDRHASLQIQRKASSVLRQDKRPRRSIGGCASSAMEIQYDICLPSTCHSTAHNQETEADRRNNNSDSTRLAKQSLVHRSSKAVNCHTLEVTTHTRAVISGADQTPQPSYAPIDCVAIETEWWQQHGLSKHAIDILLQARKQSTTKVYYRVWRTFLTWCGRRHIHWDNASSTSVVEFLTDGFKKGLGLRTLKTQISALAALTHTKWADNPIIQQFIRGVTRTRPPLKEPLATWDLPKVLTASQQPPFEPLSTCELKWLSLKVTFLVAITSAKRVSEIAALSCREPWLTIHSDKVVLRTTPGFLPKVVTDHHMNQDIVLPSFCPNPTNEKERRLKVKVKYPPNRGTALGRPHTFCTDRRAAREKEILYSPENPFLVGPNCQCSKSHPG
ncbi:hypothetical protein XENTR_v10007867 [Xenopus tropicalis]|nr:hypothetical protein XENTR_v10007867 [Xenopus tropicalis]